MTPILTLCPHCHQPGPCTCKARARTVYTSAAWQRARLAALTRDRFACTSCGARAPLDVHHIEPLGQGGQPYELENLETLCRTCHRASE
jgi:5-methylcytosine-specific restriction endonuclease McrA